MRMSEPFEIVDFFIQVFYCNVKRLSAPNEEGYVYDPGMGSWNRRPTGY